MWDLADVYHLLSYLDDGLTDLGDILENEASPEYYLTMKRSQEFMQEECKKSLQKCVNLANACNIPILKKTDIGYDYSL